MLALFIRIAQDCFKLLIFHSEKFSTDVCRLPYAVNVNLNLSNFRFLFSTLLTLLLSLLYKTLVAMRFPAKITSSCIWFRLHCDYYNRGHPDKVDQSDYSNNTFQETFYETKSFKRDLSNPLKKAYVS